MEQMTFSGMVLPTERPVLEKPKDFTDPDLLYNRLIETIQRYHPSDDISLIERAYMTAKNAHMDQRRKSGEPYIIHPLCVAIILAELELDKETIIAGLLHDVVEDTILTEGQLSRVFGADVGLLVDGVTKLTQITWTNDKLDIQAHNIGYNIVNEVKPFLIAQPSDHTDERDIRPDLKAKFFLKRLLAGFFCFRMIKGIVLGDHLVR